ncbi:hypothetical protein F7725_000114 [Dissostichus mawsoni]|uniref:Uncharacterized protein n=1 Tax=Dissostichus mawsoni TaxID=36200 RepID=A0A7J5ZFT0_DISMA|nr:hypothetical protein F7725_000114 [Dissostichus mawsoni]
MWRKKKPTSSRNRPSRMNARPAGMRKSHSSSLMADQRYKVGQCLISRVIPQDMGEHSPVLCFILSMESNQWIIFCSSSPLIQCNKVVPLCSVTLSVTLPTQPHCIMKYLVSASVTSQDQTVEDPACQHDPVAGPVQFGPPLDGVDGSVTLIKHRAQVGEVEDGQEAENQVQQHHPVDESSSTHTGGSVSAFTRTMFHICDEAQRQQHSAQMEAQPLREHRGVFSHRDMGMFQEVTTSTMERGISTLRGFTTLMSLHNKHRDTFYDQSTSTVQFPLLSSYHLMLSFSSVAPAPAHASAFTEVTHKVVTEVEGHCVLIRMQPPVHKHKDTHYVYSNTEDKDVFKGALLLCDCVSMDGDEQREEWRSLSKGRTLQCPQRERSPGTELGRAGKPRPPCPGYFSPNKEVDEDDDREEDASAAGVSAEEQTR